MTDLQHSSYSKGTIERSLFTHSKFVWRGTVSDPSSEDYDHNSLTLDGTWNDLDISSIVDIKSVGVFIKVTIKDNTAARVFQVRHPDQTEAIATSQYRNPVVNIYCSGTLICGLKKV